MIVYLLDTLENLFNKGEILSEEMDIKNENDENPENFIVLAFQEINGPGLLADFINMNNMQNWDESVVEKVVKLLATCQNDSEPQK